MIGNNNDIDDDNSNEVSPNVTEIIGLVNANDAPPPSALLLSPPPTSPTNTIIPQLQPQPQPQPQQLLVIATRIHLGESSSNINTVMIQQQMEQFYNFCCSCKNNINFNIHPKHNHHHHNRYPPTGTTTTTSPSPPFVHTIVRGVIAVDVTPNNDLIDIVRTALQDIAFRTTTTRDTSTTDVFEIDVLPVQPWGKFTPALNALLSYAANALRTLVFPTASIMVPDDTNNNPSPLMKSLSTTSTTTTVVGGGILYCSLEMTTTTTKNNNNTSSSSSSSAIQTLFQYMDYDTTLVCGAVLPGHDYQNHHPISQNDDTNQPPSNTTTTITPTTTILNGRTSPWNTFALWNINKLSKIGFVTVSDGLPVDILTPTNTSSTRTTTTTKSIAGIEEVVTIALLQKLYNPHTEMMAKLISVSHRSDDDTIVWDTTSSMSTDIGRQQWHEYKMQSKIQRAQEQLQLLSLLPPPPPTTATLQNDSGSEVSSSCTSTSWSLPGLVYHY